MCDSDHAEDKGTRHSCTGFLIFCNMALINWVSKKQATIRTSVRGAEFVATKHGIKKLQGICYKHCMMGIPLTWPSFIFADNNSQATNSIRPESTSKKILNSICYHAMQESVAMGESLITAVSLLLNLEAAQWGRSVLFSDEQKLLFEGRKKRFA